MSKYVLDYTAVFKKDLKHAKKCGYNMQLLNEVVSKLQNGEALPEKNKDHPLSGNWKGYRECHIQPDWLLVYRYFDSQLILSLTRTGSHSYLKLD